MESELLQLLDWDVMICDTDTFCAYRAELHALLEKEAGTLARVKIYAGQQLSNIALSHGFGKTAVDFMCGPFAVWL